MSTSLKADSVIIQYAEVALIPSYHACLDVVAQEQIYLEMQRPPSLERVTGFQTDLISKQGPLFYAVQGDQVVGWCDVFPKDNPIHAHRGSLGMGILPAYRGKGIGRRLLEATLQKAREFGLEKVELNVYTNNEAGIRLYRSQGFEQEGLIKKYRKINGRYYDCLVMGKFLS